MDEKRLRELAGLNEALDPKINRPLQKFDGDAIFQNKKLQAAPGLLGVAGFKELNDIFAEIKDVFDIDLDEPGGETRFDVAHATVVGRGDKLAKKFKGKVWLIETGNTGSNEPLIGFLGPMNKAGVQKWFEEFWPGVMKAVGVENPPQIKIKSVKEFEAGIDNPDSPLQGEKVRNGWLVKWEEA